MAEPSDPNLRKQPAASRPHMPGYGILDPDKGRGLLPWNWATERLASARTYWISTTRPDGRPHAMPVWGIWFDDAFFFSSGAQSRKARNLAANPACVVSIDIGEEAIVVEGIAELISDRSMIQRFNREYQLKYNWDTEGFEEPIYRVSPSVAFAFMSTTGEFTGSATRWVFGDSKAK